MAEKTLDGLKVAIIVAGDFEQIELTEPRKALEDAGAETVIIAPDAGTIQGVRHNVKADIFRVDMTLEGADPSTYDGVLLPGGALNADALRVVKRAQDFVKAIDGEKKPIAVICHGPWLLVSADLVKGRRMTSYHTIHDDIRNAGGRWEDSEVVRDRNWVSSRKPGDMPAFNREMLALFSEYKAKARKRHAA